MHAYGPEFPLLPPGLCCICEKRDPGVHMVDTRLENHYMPPSPVTGRKYVCESCVRAMGATIGMVEANEYAGLKGDMKVYQDRVTQLEGEVQNLEEALRATEILQRFAPKPAPAAKSVKLT